MVESGVDSRVSEENSKRELAQLVNALREAVIELRETLGELGNPLTQVANAGKSEEIVSVSNKTKTESNENETNGSVHVSEEKSASSALDVRRAAGKVDVKGRQVNMKNLIKFMRLANLMLDKIDKDMLMHYISFMNKLKLVKDEELELLRVIIDLVDEGRKRSLSIDEQIAIFSVIAENFGFRDELVDSELMTYVLKLIVSK